MAEWDTVTGTLASILPGNNGAATGVLAMGHINFLPDVDFLTERRLLAGWRNISSNFRQRPKA